MARRNGAWMPSQKLLMPQVSRWNAARSGAFTSAKACVGVTPTVGEPAMTKSSSQKDGGRHPLHTAA
jgi:hypothetical protein